MKEGWDTTQEPVLSICIPTYNRRKALEQTLDAILDAILFLPTGIVEVCVSDNASSDTTPKLLKEYSMANQCIITSRNKRNLGSDANKLLALKMAEGKYCWLIGDDDTILPKGLQELVHSLEQKNYTAGFIAAGTPAHINEVQRHFREKEYSVQDFIRVHGDGLEYGASEGLLAYGFMPTYLYNRKAVLKAMQKVQPPYTAWGHITLFLQCLRDNQHGRVLVASEPPLKYGRVGIEDDRMCFPPRDMELYIAERLKAVAQGQDLHNELEAQLTAWLYKHAGIRYTQNILRLMYLKHQLPKNDYNEMKSKVYSIGDSIPIPATKRAMAYCLKLLEKFPPACAAVAFRYKHNSRYAKQVEDYKSGKRLTNEQGEKGVDGHAESKRSDCQLERKAIP